MEISKAIIHNFQSIKHLEVDFVDGITTFVGSTDSGKSACIRAILWVINNEFMECHWGEKECFVEIHFSDGNIVKRYKSPSKNAYYLNGLEFTAMGKSGVPDEIARVININEVNIKEQEDQQYLIACNAGERARIFNKIIHLEKIERATRIINQKSKKVKSDIDTLQIIIDSRTQELSKLADLSLVEPLMLELEQLCQDKATLSSKSLELENLRLRMTELSLKLSKYKNLDDLKLKSNNLRKLSDKYKKLVETLNVVEASLNSSKLIEKLKFLSEVSKQNKTYKALSSNYRCISENKDKLSTVVNEIIRYENRSQKDIDSIKALVLKLKECYTKQKESKDTFKSILSSLDNVKKQNQIKLEIQNKKLAVEAEKAQYIKENPTCPTCGKLWN